MSLPWIGLCASVQSVEFDKEKLLGYKSTQY